MEPYNYADGKQALPDKVIDVSFTKTDLVDAVNGDVIVPGQWDNRTISIDDNQQIDGYTLDATTKYVDVTEGTPAQVTFIYTPVAKPAPAKEAQLGTAPFVHETVGNNWQPADSVTKLVDKDGNDVNPAQALADGSLQVEYYKLDNHGNGVSFARIGNNGSTTPATLDEIHSTVGTYVAFYVYEGKVSETQIFVGTQNTPAIAEPIIYEDNGQAVGQPTIVKGMPGDTYDVAPGVPKGYHLVNPADHIVTLKNSETPIVVPIAKDEVPATPINPAQPVNPSKPSDNNGDNGNGNSDNNNKPSEPSTPTNPSQPVNPSQPSDNNGDKGNGNSDNNNKPSEPSTPTNPSTPINPPVQPVDPSKPNDNNGDKGNGNSDNNKPSEPSTPTNPSKPSDNNGDKGNGSSDNNKPSEPSTPSNPSQPVNPSNPSDKNGDKGNGSSDNNKPSEPSTPSNPSQPVNPGKPSDNNGDKGNGNSDSNKPSEPLTPATPSGQTDTGSKTKPATPEVPATPSDKGKKDDTPVKNHPQTPAKPQNDTNSNKVKSSSKDLKPNNSETTPTQSNETAKTTVAPENTQAGTVQANHQAANETNKHDALPNTGSSNDSLIGMIVGLMMSLISLFGFGFLKKNRK
ncbi:mucin-binding protein [Fructilactobacillus sp. Tb1]|uniref:mucin-binding protein n=1 Tax=Fructilactobacillus sp. Tb1 TaxID=3422304 RepID=UPI003D296029